MNRIVQVVNSIGILALALLCCVQWQANRRVNLEAIGLERTRIEQEAKLASQDQTIRGDASDLADFRRRLTLLASDLKDVQNKLAASDAQSSHLTAQCGHLTAERDQLKSTLDKWVAAVANRDEALRKAGAQVQGLAAERNEAIKKYNDLVGKYNDLVNNLNNAATRP